MRTLTAAARGRRSTAISLIGRSRSSFLAAARLSISFGYSIVQMFNVSALLPYDALLKCVVTEVVLFSIVAFKTLDISQGSVTTHLIEVWLDLS